MFDSTLSQFPNVKSQDNLCLCQVKIRPSNLQPYPQPLFGQYSFHAFNLFGFNIVLISANAWASSLMHVYHMEEFFSLLESVTYVKLNPCPPGKESQNLVTNKIRVFKVRDKIHNQMIVCGDTLINSHNSSYSSQNILFYPYVVHVLRCISIITFQLLFRFECA